MDQNDLRDGQKSRKRVREGLGHKGLDPHADHRLRGTEKIQVTKFVEGPEGGLVPEISYLEGHRPVRKEG